MLFFLTIAALLGIYHQAQAADPCHMREVDMCMSPMMIANEMPTNDEELDKTCEIMDEIFGCTHNYTEMCFTPMMKEFMDMIIAEPMESQKKMCTRGSDERARFLKNAPCLKRALSNDNMRSHMDDMVATLEMATTANFDERIPILCCGGQRMYKASLKLVESECGSEVLEEGSEIMGMSMSSITDVFCHGYDPEGEKCVGRLTAPGTKSKGTKSDSQFIRLVSTVMSSYR